MSVEFTPGLSDDQKRTIGLLPDDPSSGAKRGGEPLRDIEDTSPSPQPPPPPTPEPLPPPPHSTPIEVPAALVTRINGAPEIKLRAGRHIVRTDGSTPGELASKKEEVIEGLIARMGQVRSWAQQIDRGTKPNISGRSRRGQSPVDAWIDTIAGIYREMGMDNDIRTLLRDFANAEGLSGDLDAKVRENKQKADAAEKVRLAEAWKALDAVPAQLDAFDEILVAAPATGTKKQELLAIIDGTVTSLDTLKAGFSGKLERVESIFIERSKLQMQALKDYFNRLYGTYGNTLPQSLLDFTKNTLALILSSESRTAAVGLLRGKRDVSTIAVMHDALNQAQMPKVQNLSELCVLLNGVPEVPTNLGKDKKSGAEAADFIRKEVVLGMGSDAFTKQSLDERSEKIEQFRSYFGIAEGVLSKVFHKLLSQIESVRGTYKELFDANDLSINELIDSFNTFIGTQQQKLDAALAREKELRALIAAPDSDAATKNAASAELPAVTTKVTETRAAINENFYKLASDLGKMVQEQRAIAIKSENAEMESFSKKRYAALRLFQEEFARFSTLDANILKDKILWALNGDSWKDEAAPKGATEHEKAALDRLDASELDKIRGEIASFNVKRTGKRMGLDGKPEWYVTEEDTARAKREVTDAQVMAHLAMRNGPRKLTTDQAVDKFTALFTGVNTKDALIHTLAGFSSSDALFFLKRREGEIIVNSLRNEFLRQFSRFKDGSEFKARPKEQQQRIVVEYLNGLPASYRRIFTPIFETELFSGERLEGVNMEKGAAGEPIPKADAGPNPEPQAKGEIVHPQLWKTISEERVGAPAPAPARTAAPAGTAAAAAPSTATFTPTPGLWKNVAGPDATETPPVPLGTSTESASSSEDELRALVDQVSLPFGLSRPVMLCVGEIAKSTPDTEADVIEKYRSGVLSQLPELAKKLRTHAALFSTLVSKLNVSELTPFPKLGEDLATIAESSTPDLAKLFKGLVAYFAAKNSMEWADTAAGGSK